MTDDDYYTIRTGGGEGRDEGGHRPRPLRVALAFAAGALAVTLVAVPMASEHMDETRLASRPLDLDTRAVGSIGASPRASYDGTYRATRRVPRAAPGELPRGTARGASRAPAVDAKRYVVRRSVLSHDGVCVIRGNGGRSGNC